MGVQSPEEFDIEAFISGASAPRRSVRIYQRGDLIATLDALGQQIAIAESVKAQDEPGLADDPSALREEYAQIAEQWQASGRDFIVRGFTEDEKRAVLDGLPEDQKADPMTVGYAIIAAAVESPKVTAAQMKALHDAVGEAQYAQLAVAFTDACKNVLKPSADFLPRASTQVDGDES